MRSGEFNQFMASVLDVPLPGMIVTVRSLRDAGLIEIAGRGLYARHLGLYEAGLTLLAYLAAERPGESAARRIEGLRGLSRTPDDAELPALRIDPGAMSLETAILEVLAIYAAGERHPPFAAACGVARDGTRELPPCTIEVHPQDEFAVIVLAGHRYTFDRWPPRGIADAAPEAVIARIAAIEAPILARIAAGFPPPADYEEADE